MSNQFYDEKKQEKASVSGSLLHLEDTGRLEEGGEGETKKPETN